MASTGWRSGLGWEGNVQLAKNVTDNLYVRPCEREWREPEWPIYRFAIFAKYAGG